MFYVVCDSEEQRSQFIEELKKVNILSVFHYLSLHKSPFYQDKYQGATLKNSDRYSQCLLRLPFYYELEESTINSITKILNETLKTF